MGLNGETTGTLQSGTAAPCSVGGSAVIHHTTFWPFMVSKGGKERKKERQDERQKERQKEGKKAVFGYQVTHLVTLTGGNVLNL